MAFLAVKNLFTLLRGIISKNNGEYIVLTVFIHLKRNIISKCMEMSVKIRIIVI